MPFNEMGINSETKLNGLDARVGSHNKNVALIEADWKRLSRNLDAQVFWGGGEESDTMERLDLPSVNDLMGYSKNWTQAQLDNLSPEERFTEKETISLMLNFMLGFLFMLIPVIFVALGRTFRKKSK